METPEPLTRPDYDIPPDIRPLGVGKLKRYVIAVKVQGEPWPPRFFGAIHTARRQFDAGTHIMMQGKHPDGWVIQYSVPRRRPLKNPTAYFARNWGVFK